MKIIGFYRNAHGLIFPTPFVFPGGEVQVNIDKLQSEGLLRVVLHADLRSSDHIMELLLVTDALRRRIGTTPVHLIMPYVPYARQDRVCNPGEALGVKVFCRLINAQDYASVTIVDPHSDVAAALLDRVAVVDPSVPVGQVLSDPAFAHGVALVSPDAGASKKVLKLAKAFAIKDVLFADKVRNTLTGDIESVDVRGTPATNLPMLVVDDICDGGRTFLELATALGRRTDAPLYLYVTHGIFSKGVEPLLDAGYQKIFTTHDWTGTRNPRVQVIPLKGIA